VLDIVRITRMVSWKLLSRGLYVSGLVRLLRAERLQGAEAGREAGPAG
jgi:hypothetical protein